MESNKALFVTSCLVLLLQAQANADDHSSWNELQISPKAIGYMPFRDSHITIYESIDNMHTNSRGNHQNMYYCSPILLLQPTTAEYTFDITKLQHTVMFDVLIWNANVKQAVFEYMNKEMNMSVTKSQINPIPFDRLLLVCQTDAETCRCPTEWRSNMLHNTVPFNMVCPSKSEALKFVKALKSVPKQFHSVFKMVFNMAAWHSKVREVVINVSSIRNGKLMSELEQKFPGKGEVLLTADDANQLISESIANVFVQTFSENDEVFSEQSEKMISNTLKNMLVAGTKRIDADFKLWDMVYWNADNYRPDELAYELNELTEKLDTNNYNRLVGAMSKESKNVSEIVEILHSSATKHEETNSKTDNEQVNRTKDDRETITNQNQDTSSNTGKIYKNTTSVNGEISGGILGIGSGSGKFGVELDTSGGRNESSSNNTSSSRTDINESERDTIIQLNSNQSRTSNESNSTHLADTVRTHDEDSVSHNAEKNEKKRAIKESFSKVEWKGRKFVPKPMTLTRVNLANVRDEQNMKNRKVSVTIYTATLSLNVNIDLDMSVLRHGYDELYSISSTLKEELLNMKSGLKVVESDLEKMKNDALAQQSFLKGIVYDEKEAVLEELSSAKLGFARDIQDLKASLKNAEKKFKLEMELFQSESDRELTSRLTELKEVFTENDRQLRHKLDEVTWLVFEAKANASTENKILESEVKRLKEDLLLKEKSLKEAIAHEKDSWKMLVSPKVKFYSIGVSPDTKEKIKANWFEAGSYCRISNMNLAAIESRQDYEAFKKIVAAIDPGTDDLFFWTDGTRLGKTTSRREDFYWASTLTPIGNFQFWVDGEPNNHLNREHCLDMKRSTSLLGELGLHDEDCTSLRYFICQSYI